MSGPRVKFRGIKRIKRNVNAKRRSFPIAVEEAVDLVSLTLLELANELVPVDKGDLRASGRIEKSKAQPNGLVIGAVVYGGTSRVQYATSVHEDPSRKEGRKYLERPGKTKKRPMQAAYTGRLKGAF